MKEEYKQKMEYLVKQELESFEKYFKLVLPKGEYERGVLLIQNTMKDETIFKIIIWLGKKWWQVGRFFKIL